MKKLVNLFVRGMAYFCVATVLAQVVLLGMMWFKGALSAERGFQLLAAVHGVDVAAIQQKKLKEKAVKNAEHVSRDQVVSQRMLKSFDMDLRETAMEKGMLSLGALRNTVVTNQKHFTEQKDAYDQRLEQLSSDALAEGLQEAQRNLEAMKPRQAKEQILMMIDDNRMGEVVTILKALPMEKRKKIFVEFKDAGDDEKLYDLMLNIAAGEPTVTEIEAMRENIKQFNLDQ